MEWTADEVLERTQWDLFWVPPDTRILDRPELLVIAHPSGRPELNVVSRIRGTPAEMPALVDEVEAFQGDKDSRFLVVPSVPDALPGLLEARGYRREFEGFAFTAAVDGWEPRRSVAGWDCRRVTDLASLRACLAITDEAFREVVARDASDLARELAQCGGPEPRVLRFVVRDGHGEPMASGGLTVHPTLSFGLLWAGGTRPGARGQGAYTALVAARIRAARTLGLTRVGLYADAKTSGPIVAAHGFVRAGPITDWVLTRRFGRTWRPSG